MAAEVAREWITIQQWANDEKIALSAAHRRLRRVGIEVVDGLLDRADANEKWRLYGNHKLSAARLGKSSKPKPAEEQIPLAEPVAAEPVKRRRGRPPAPRLNLPAGGPVGPPNLVAIDGGQESQLSAAEIDRRKQLVKLRMEELKLANQLGSVYPAEEVDAHIKSMLVAARETLWHMPRELADKLAALTDPVEVMKVLEGSVSGVLAKLMNFQPKRGAKK